MPKMLGLEREMRATLTIPDKFNRVVDFRPWPNQLDYLHRTEVERPPLRRVHLKARQVGESAIILARNALQAMRTPNFTVLVICQDKPTRELFRFRYKHHLKDLERRGLAPHVGTDNEDMLEFDLLGSRILFETAEGQGVGRAWTINRLHATEVAHWKHPAKTLTGALQSVPSTGEVDIESTPYGAGGPFHRCVQSALSGREYGDSHWELFFYPWWKTAEYQEENDEPLDDLTEHEEFLMREHGLGFGHIRWRRKKVAELLVAGEPFEQEYPEDPITCFLGGRRLAFPMDVIKSFMEFTRDPIKKCNPRNPDAPGRLWVWKEPRGPQRYLVAADISEGIGQDYFAAVVLDVVTCEVVAAFYDNTVDPVEAADILDAMGRWYNNALMVPETYPGIGYATGKRLEQEYNYPNLHYHIDPKGFGTLGDVGWRTDARTRPMIRSALMDHIPTHSLILWDTRAVSEMSSLVWAVPEGDDRSKRPRLEAVPGEYDDYMMALGIGLVVRDMVALSRPHALPSRSSRPLRTGIAI